MEQSNGPRRLHDLSSSDIDWTKYKNKNYLHFDKNVGIKHIKKDIQNDEWISSYAFLPFIKFEIVFKKYITLKNRDQEGNIVEEKVIRKKERNIMYSAHKDSFIHKYYGELLNNAYNAYALTHGIDNIATAYRNNKPGKNNIDFAYEVFEHMHNQSSALIISMDFTKFFDKISHTHLKRNLKEVLNLNELPKNWYKVFKSITKYSYVNKIDIDSFLKRKYGIKRLKSMRLSRIMEFKEFKEFKKDNLHYNKNVFGIPQGSGISAVFSNVHLINFDKEILEWSKSKNVNSLYRRYCDDLILIIPINNIDKAKTSTCIEEIFEIIKRYESSGLEIQYEKTEVRFFEKNQIYKISDINKDKKILSSLDYLGFVTDGKFLRIREKSLFKYFTRAYKKAKASKRIGYATKRPGPKRELYDLYTHLGYDYKEYGNFVTYAYRAHKIMSKLPSKSMIKKQVKRHWLKINKRLS
ncbi:reverse transcriptase domain-containing protein [uncultured Exiguobacterium sp.]|uniref:reverse transcriptase domain-containing protein n=1 Tax=uncultured Exiguobacterium sp. TaxID=202669 RepID=UPI0025D497E1|nr:reverse transcriptase domain-containing protein [uncultured Exiguobacterium sp.]